MDDGQWAMGDWHGHGLGTGICAKQAGPQISKPNPSEAGKMTLLDPKACSSGPHGGQLLSSKDATVEQALLLHHGRGHIHGMGMLTDSARAPYPIAR